MLLKERDNARNKLRKTCDEVGIVKDEIEDLKLELEIVNKYMEARIEQAFKKSEEIDRLKGKYVLGSYIKVGSSFPTSQDARGLSRKTEDDPENY